MGRIPRIHRVARAGRSPYWEIRIKGKLVYLGTDGVDAHKKSVDLISQHYGQAQPAPGPPVEIAGLINRWLDAYPTEYHEEVIKPFAAFARTVKLAEMPSTIVSDFVADLLRRKRSAKTARTYASYALSVLRWGQDRAWVGRFLAVHLPRPTRHPRDVPSPQLRATFGSLAGLRAEAILRFILETGCRPSEACELTWDKVDLARGTIVLGEHKTDRFGNPRVICLTPAARELLEVTKEGRRVGPVFVNRFGRPYKQNGLRSILRRHGGFCPYRLRHTFAQAALETQPMEVVARLLGHADLQTVQVYASIRSDRARAAASSLTSPLAPPPQAKAVKKTAKRGRASGRGARRRPAND